MASFVICCQQSGQCVITECTGNQFLCDQLYNQCISGGGFPQGPFNGESGSPCDFFTLPNGSGIPCDQLGACIYHDGSGNVTGCAQTNVAVCNASGGEFHIGQPCPTATEYDVRLFPVMSRVWPHHFSFSTAYHGLSTTLPVPSDFLYAACTPAPGVPCNVFRLHVFHDGPRCYTSKQMESVGRVYLDRRKSCFKNGAELPGLNETQCFLQGGEWRFNGLMYLTPALPICHTDSIPDVGCGKPTKLALALGKWKFVQTTPTPKCLNPDTSQELPYTTSQSCSQHGGIWVPDYRVKPPHWEAVHRTVTGASNAWQDAKYGRRALDMPGANEYDWMMLVPVERLQDLPPGCCGGGGCPDTYADCYGTPRTIPYCNETDAHTKFPFHDCFTEEIQCVTRDYDRPLPSPPYPPDSFERVSGAPYHNRAWGDGGPVHVPAGILGIVGHASTARNTFLQSYCAFGSIAGCPPGCIYDVQGGKNCLDMAENVTKRYQAKTGTTRYVWELDSEKRGWWVEYTTYVDAWFAQDMYWMGLVDYAFPQFCQRPQQRWNAWYSGKVIANYFGDVTDAEFKAFILEHDSGFGIEFEPLNAGCNDAILNAYNVPKSLSGSDGASFYPPPLTQAGCSGAGIMQPKPPCLQQGHAPSSWFMGAFGAICPENGVYHKTTRKRYTDPELETFATSQGWAKLYFSTMPPFVDIA